MTRSRTWVRVRVRVREGEGEGEVVRGEGEGEGEGLTSSASRWRTRPTARSTCIARSTIAEAPIERAAPGRRHRRLDRAPPGEVRVRVRVEGEALVDALDAIDPGHCREQP